MIYDAVIIGGGAAGLFCAIEAGKRGKRVLVVEHNTEPGRKILISGGGRCNFTNIVVQPEHFLSQNPHFCKSALSQYTSADFINLIKRNKIPFFEKKHGQLFCKESSRAIVAMLLAECRAARVDVRTGCSVSSLSRDQNFRIETTHETFEGRALVVACGGLSFPKIGASDLGYRVARQFGLKVTDTRPSLVAMVLGTGARSDLAGVSVDAVVSSDKRAFRENILFTHRGLSGPAILQISNYWKRNGPISIDLAPDIDITAMLIANRKSRQKLENFLSTILPARFAAAFATDETPNKPLYQMNDREIDAIGETLSNWQVYFRETEGYGRAEVTLGGVSTADLSSTTMEAKKVPGLYFIGEVVDVTGWLGGYNFQWAWSSGFVAGKAL